MDNKKLKEFKNSKYKYTKKRYFCDVVSCDKYDMDRLLNIGKFISRLPPEINGTGLYREDQIKEWFNNCIKDGFTLYKPIRDDGFQYFYGYRK